MASLQVRNFSNTKQKALEDANKMQALVEDECAKEGKEPPPYQLQELIGKGNYGRVYKAKDLKHDRVVAVKIINIEEGDTLNPKFADTYSEFMKEFNTLKRLSESGAKNINLTLDVLPVGQTMWMVTEYCAGGSVATLMRPSAPGGLQEKWIIPIVREVAEAIYWVHKEGIIHRDIKCANVLVTEAGGVQLCDFGVAGIIESKLDKRTTFIGTLHWMAPELFDPEPSYSTPVDIWAFGSLVYEIASGLPPNAMQGFNISQLGQHIKHHDVRLEGDQYSDNLKDLVAFCLVEDPAKRPTIEEVQKHPYIYNTEEAYPTSSLSQLVKAYKLWEAQGGTRKSLFAPVGAQGPDDMDSGSANLIDDEWNFSTTLDFDMQVMNADARTVYDVYGSNVDFEFQEPTSRPIKKGRRRLPPQLQPLKQPLEKVFDPNTISNYEENSRAYYGRGPPTVTATAPPKTSDLPLRDNSLHSTLRESLIDLDAGLYEGPGGDYSSNYVDMATIRGAMRLPSDVEDNADGGDVDGDADDYNKPPLSDPVDLDPKRRTQDWKFPTMIPPASANPDVSRFPSHDDDAPRFPGGNRPVLYSHPAAAALGFKHTDPSSFNDASSIPAADNRASVGSLIDLDESLPPAMPDPMTRPGTGYSDGASVAGSDLGGAGPFDLEQRASMYFPPSSGGVREPSIYVSEESDLALGKIITTTQPAVPVDDPPPRFPSLLVDADDAPPRYPSLLIDDPAPRQPSLYVDDVRQPSLLIEDGDIRHPSLLADVPSGPSSVTGGLASGRNTPVMVMRSEPPTAVHSRAPSYDENASDFPGIREESESPHPQELPAPPPGPPGPPAWRKPPGRRGRSHSNASLGSATSGSGPGPMRLQRPPPPRSSSRAAGNYINLQINRPPQPPSQQAPEGAERDYLPSPSLHPSPAPSRGPSPSPSPEPYLPSSSSLDMGHSHLPPAPAFPSDRVLLGAASKEQVREEVMRLLASFAAQLGATKGVVKGLPVRRVVVRRREGPAPSMGNGGSQGGGSQGGQGGAGGRRVRAETPVGAGV
ncbi:uncharacterized protein CTHT_0057120 [Thermochaetoides thermophila DSM 1495]|uniref:non-specific serine/threonine protein kinase n=1 Tax=Chaetomium thermophilum (strain DSM 1495 / CBS 144.50 / IMI 039719) TaxID=759272 RepID=G0SCG3_CHATD|nr:hypothetical protein CTHT_0057120 [Thermochaetoides thermophila DSM 1495]EGS19089.1 hypothetical protein CTHT_0057120 [Thermochaetoides thermophila DSM 1495]